MLPGGGERAQLPALNQWGARRARAQHLGVPRHRGRGRRCGTPERHVQEVDGGALLEHFHAQLVLAAVAARGISQRRLGRARVFDEFRERLDRQLGIDREHELVGGDARHRQEVIERVEAQLGIDMGIDGDAAVGMKEQRVAVGGGLRDRVGGDVAVGARAVLDHDRPSQRLLHVVGEQPRGDIRRAARWDGHQDLDRSRWKGSLCLRHRGEQDNEQHDCNAHQVGYHRVLRLRALGSSSLRELHPLREPTAILHHAPPV